MSRATAKLTALKVERVRKLPGMYADGAGLYLQVTEGGASWVYRYMLNGKARYMGLGPLELYGLGQARARALDARRLRHEGVDPIDSRRTERARTRLEAAKAMTFKEATKAYIEAKSIGWTGAKVKALWEATLATYAEPVLGALSVQAIDTALVLKVLEPIWTSKPETASRVRMRIEKILDWAKVKGYREGENPARWRGHLRELLAAPEDVRKVEHHAALPYAEVGAFMVELKKQEGVAARALEFAILTAARTSEVLSAQWSEVDLTARLWTVPAERMKAGKEHRVPLSTKTLAILKEMEPRQHAAIGQDEPGAFIFPGAKQGRPLSNMALLMTLRRMDRGDLTAHGFRSTFRDWAAERTSFPAEVAEMALAHTVPDKVEAAYRRGDLFDKRRRFMEAWAMFCAAVPKQPLRNNVTVLRQAS
jgi:integrase